MGSRVSERRDHNEAGDPLAVAVCPMIAGGGAS
jgi:hypothetical protein